MFGARNAAGSRGRSVSSSTRPSGGSASTTSTSSTPSSGPGSSRSAPTSRIRPRCGCNGHEWAKRQARARGRRASPRWPTGSPPATSPTRCRRSATGSAPTMCRGSSTAGSSRSRRRSPHDDRDAGYWWELSMRQVEVSPHPGVRRPPPGPGVLRGAGGRQHRHRPPRAGRGGVRPPGAAGRPPASSAPGSSGRAPR